jgi:hypothetical protein
MAKLVDVTIFCEDIAHERFVEALVRRVAKEQGCLVRIRTVSGSGGHGRVLRELQAVQRALEADLLVVAIDANCKRWNKARGEIEAKLDASRFLAQVVACPDPHIERWYLADPEALKKTLNVSYTLGKRKCERDRYKQHLRTALEKGGHTVTLGGAEFASEIVEALDLFRAAKNEPSFGHFVDALRAAVRRFT